MSNRPILTLAELDAFDPHSPPGRKWCPLCGQDKPKDAAHRCLSIERSSGLWNCFRCGASGQAREFWSENPTFLSREAKRNSLRAAFSLGDGAVTPNKVSLAPSKAAGGTETPPAAQANWKVPWQATEILQGTAGARYLAKRSISQVSASNANVRWSRNWNGQGAVVFPLQSRAGEVIAAQARAVRGTAKLTAGPKKEGAFFAPVTLVNGRVCVPLDAAVPAIIVVEAPIDALSLATCGFPALALCGTSGPSWFHLACGLRRVALALDADEAGESASTQIAQILQPFGARCERLCPESYKDWNDWLVARGPHELTDWLTARLLISPSP